MNIVAVDGMNILIGPVQDRVHMNVTLNLAYAMKILFPACSTKRRVRREICRVFQKELYNFGSLYKFIQRTCAVFRTAIM
jgi:hypothetical protein